jgi:chromosome segregation ATPase
MTELTPTVIIAVCAILTFVATAAGICTKLFLSKLKDVQTILTQEIESIEDRVALLNLRADALDQKSDDKEARLVRVEMAIDNIKEGQLRIEAEVKDSRMHIEAKLDKKFDQLVESIREIRDVKPRQR